MKCESCEGLGSYTNGFPDENGDEECSNCNGTGKQLEEEVLTAWTEETCHGECVKCSNKDCGSR